MRLPKRGERGFTLIELLIVVAILGVLAAVVIPNVTRFVGAGEQEAAETELHNVQLAVTSMMLENGITTIPNPSPATDPASPQDNKEIDMHKFPDDSTPAQDLAVPPGPNKGYTVTPLPTDPPIAGYLLYGHDKINPDGQGFETVNYVTVATTTYSYTCEADGTVQQWDINGNPLVWD